ncbi:MAG: hypothetical protein WA417_22330 [Stellaceae bacterium]
MLGADRRRLGDAARDPPLLSMTFVIEVFVYPEYWAMHLMWTSLLLFLVTKGPDVFSLDHCARRILRAKGILV